MCDTDISAVYDWLSQYPTSLLCSLRSSLRCYEISLSEVKRRVQTTKDNQEEKEGLERRLGNICNELGVHLMNLSAHHTQDKGTFEGYYLIYMKR